MRNQLGAFAVLLVGLLPVQMTVCEGGWAQVTSDLCLQLSRFLRLDIRSGCYLSMWGRCQKCQRLKINVREKAEKKPKWTGLIIVDSQATKNTCNSSIESKGFCSYKATNCLKKNLGVDSLGLPFFTPCTRASLSDDKSLIEMKISTTLNRSP